jgi:RND family efflux transporter MFP subunit
MTTTRPALARAVTLSAVLATLAACSRGGDAAPPQPAAVTGETVIVRDTMLAGAREAAGIAAPVAEAQLASRLMGAVISVAVVEGQRVGAGAVLARVDARDLAARRAQAEAGLRSAEAAQAEAAAQAERIRGLYRDSAATPAQLDAVEAGLARATGAVQAARGALDELAAVAAYAEVRAPFAGTVVKRFVDPGDFVGPGMPLVTVQDARRLRVAVTVEPALAATLEAGQQLSARIEGRTVTATIEGIVPTAGALYAVQAIVPNPAGDLLPGSAATLELPLAARRMLVIPARALVREGELVGVRVPGVEGPQLRWLQLGATIGELMEVRAGLAAGDRVLLPAGGQ